MIITYAYRQETHCCQNMLGQAACHWRQNGYALWGPVLYGRCSRNTVYMHRRYGESLQSDLLLGCEYKEKRVCEEQSKSAGLICRKCVPRQFRMKFVSNSSADLVVLIRHSPALDDLWSFFLPYKCECTFIVYSILWTLGCLTWNARSHSYGGLWTSTCLPAASVQTWYMFMCC